MSVFLYPLYSNHLERLSKPIPSCSIHLILSVDKYRHCGEVTVKCGRFSITAKDETKDLYAVIDLLAAKVGRQLKSHLAKVATQHTRTPSAGEVLSVAEEFTNT